MCAGDFMWVSGVGGANARMIGTIDASCRSVHERDPIFAVPFLY